MAWTTHTYDDNQALVAELSPAIADYLAQAIAARGRASLAVSGGSTPRGLFQDLSRAVLDWSKVTVTLVDERWVDEKHPDSNARLVRENLLQHRAAAARFIGLTTRTDSPFEAQAEIDTRLAAIPAPIDVVILGMGGDGHTASFFPGAETLDQALHPDTHQRCCAIRPPHAPHERMTLTLPTILNCEHLMLHIVGADKWQVLSQAMQPGSTRELPVRAVLHQTQKLLDIYYAPA